jgi:hypothetical protein
MMNLYLILDEKRYRRSTEFRSLQLGNLRRSWSSTLGHKFRYYFVGSWELGVGSWELGVQHGSPNSAAQY